MHNTLKSKLPGARGSSDHVVAIFLDVRGFSSFAGTAESINAALFLRSVYTRIIDRYFPDATFFKLTGDGMMIIRKYDEDDLNEIVNDSLEKSIVLVDAFPKLCAGDDMINFAVPEYLGIGIARGAATRLASDAIILDYSGRPLNLAARLMDFARPSGVVFNVDSLGLNVISKELLDQFTEDHVYVKGISEDAPLSIHYLTARTKIEPSSHLPINKFKTKATTEVSMDMKTIETRSGILYFHQLPEKPDLIHNCRIFFTYPRTNRDGRKHPTDREFRDFPAVFGYFKGDPGVNFNYSEIYKLLKAKGVKGTWPITMYIEYEMVDADPSRTEKAHSV